MASRETRSDSKVRRLSGFANGLLGVFLSIITIGSAFWVIEVPVLFDLALFTEQFLGLLLALTLASVFLGIRASGTAAAEHVPWYDWVLAGLSLIVGGYVGFLFPAISLTLGSLSPERWILGGIAIFLVLEGTRRTIGWAVVWLAVVHHALRKVCLSAPRHLLRQGIRRGSASPPISTSTSTASSACPCWSRETSSSRSSFSARRCTRRAATGSSPT